MIVVGQHIALHIGTLDAGNFMICSWGLGIAARGRGSSSLPEHGLEVYPSKMRIASRLAGEGGRHDGEA
jgi:hypothetical protein